MRPEFNMSEVVFKCLNLFPKAKAIALALALAVPTEEESRREAWPELFS